MSRPYRPHDAPTPDAAAEERRLTEVAFARCFAGADGERALAHLARITVERVLGPEASDAGLRDLEGQRRLHHHILGLIERGRTAPGARA
ncbi:hypothetical protein KAJ83_15660 [Marivibrio halodurans]|uniref:Bbp19-like phage domain-containing protein n=1 Tax=Marivibrio halodurans TaxID=2039722 RepID=A0A8J7SAH0_9PROT|nr:hypothetical protein [Marivibrio halodurans]MBP5858457.1 hypothetical protein [Marivibrio halodurans]